MFSFSLRPSLSALAVALFLPLAVTRAAEPGPAPMMPEPSAAAATPPASSPTAPVTQSEPVELPKFRSGLWEYRRTLVSGHAAKPQVTTIKKCADPGEEMRTKMGDLKKKGCQFAPLKHSNGRYISSWICQTQTGALRFRDVLTVKDENGYQDVSETHSAQSVTQQKIEATRLGECPGMGSGAPLLPTPKSRRPPPITPPSTAPKA